MLRQEIDTLKDEMTAAIQAPIMIISDTVGKLINNSGVSNEVSNPQRYFNRRQSKNNQIRKLSLCF